VKKILYLIKRGKDPQKIKSIMQKLINNQKLEAKYHEHKLAGIFKDRKECHIEPDWLLIYKLSENEIIFERTGSHSDIFE